MSTEGSIRVIIANACGVDADRIELDTTFVAYGLDSIRAMDLVVALEEVFNVAIPDDLARRVKTLRELVEYIQGQLARCEQFGFDHGAAGAAE